MQNQDNDDPNFSEGFAQLEAMRLGTCYRQTVTVRGYSVEMRPLTVAEHMGIAASIKRELSSVPQFMQTSLQQNLLLAQRCLEKASTPSPREGSIPVLTNFLLEKMTNDELMAVYKQWLAICERVDPNFEDIPDEEIIALADKLRDEISVKKNPSAVIALSFSQLANLVHFLLTKPA